MTNAAVILSGCGHADGAEIRESVLALLALDREGVRVDVFAPDIAQAEVRDCTTGALLNESRNVLKEAGRIARGAIRPLAQLKAADYDLLVIPGGFGVAKNLSDFAAKGAEATVNPDFKRAVEAFHAAKKPIAAICIAPAVLAVALKGKGITVTIGEDKDVAAAIAATGNHHKDSPSDKAVVDETHRVVTCSAYMRDDALAPIAKGIEECVAAAVRLSGRARNAA